jgi:hypothetical protein
MRVQEIWKFIYPRVSYSPRALPLGNMIRLGESIFIFPSPACNECIIWNHRYQNSIHFYCQPVWSYSKIREITIVITVTYVMERRLNNELICTCTLCNVIKFVAVLSLLRQLCLYLVKIIPDRCQIHCYQQNI